MKYAEDVVELVGNTPLVKLKNASVNKNLVLGKCEFMNPTSSVKDRAGFNMIQDALKKGLITKKTTILEPTSGNTGIAIASICATLGIKLILVMPESMSIERRKIFKAFGAEVVLTSASKGMTGSIEKVLELKNDIKDSFIPQQFENLQNPIAHKKTTALEILHDTNGKVDIFVASVGTGGTLTGIGEVLKSYNPEIKIIAVEPEDSAVLSGEDSGSHKIQGIGAGFVPKILNTGIYDEVIKVPNEKALVTSRKLASKEGLLVGISTGANVWAAKQLAKRKENKDKIIVTILCDTGERYLSSELFEY